MTTSEDRYQEAVTAFEAGDLDAAMAAGTALVADDQNYGDAYNLLSAIAQDQGRLGDAESFARSALATDITNPLYHNTLANALLKEEWQKVCDENRI